MFDLVQTLLFPIPWALAAHCPCRRKQVSHHAPSRRPIHDSYYGPHNMINLGLAVVLDLGPSLSISVLEGDLHCRRRKRNRGRRRAASSLCERLGHQSAAAQSAIIGIAGRGGVGGRGGREDSHLTSLLWF